MKHYYTRDFGEMGSLVIPKKSMGVEVYPLPFGFMFFRDKDLSKGFFVLEEISKVVFDALLELCEGIREDTPDEILEEREKAIGLILQAL